MGQNRKNRQGPNKKMSEKKDYLKELKEDIIIERRLWLKEILVFIILIILTVIREVYLDEWFNFTTL
jgi:hypothetical protein